MLSQGAQWKHNASNQIAVLIVALSFVYFVGCSRGLGLVCLGPAFVFFEIVHTHEFAYNAAVDSALVHRKGV